MTLQVCVQNDSIEGIYDTLKECAAISKSAGGIGLHIHNIRAVGSYIRGTNGTSNGIVPMLRVFNDTARQSACPCPDPCVRRSAMAGVRWVLLRQVCGPGRWQAKGRICHLPRAVARRHL